MTWISPQGPNDLQDSLAQELQILNGNLYASGGGLWKFDGTKWLTVSDENIDKVVELDGVWFAESNESQVLGSTDGGLNWTSKSIGLPTRGHIFSFFTAQNKLFVALLPASVGAVQLYTSSNLGEDWFEYTSSTGNGIDWDITGDADTPVGIFLSTYGGLVRSTDGGGTWSRDTTFGFSYIGSASSFNGGVLVSTAYHNSSGKPAGFCFSRDGIHWMRELGSLEDVSGFTTDSSYAYASTYGRGIWRTSIASLDVSSSVNIVQTEIELYPNPAKSIVNIKTPSSIEFPAVLSVFDETGRQVSTKHVRSSADMSLDIGHLAAGRYNIMVSSASFIGTGRLLIDRE